MCAQQLCLSVENETRVLLSAERYHLRCVNDCLPLMLWIGLRRQNVSLIVLKHFSNSWIIDRSLIFFSKKNFKFSLEM